MKVSFLTDTWDKSPVALSRHWGVLSDWLCSPAEGTDKKGLTMWSPCSFDGGSKKMVSAVEVSCLVFDMDEGMPFDFHERFQQWTYTIHTSWSHSYTTPKWRLVMPLAEPVPASDWVHAFEAGCQLFGEVTGYPDLIDGSCKNANRFYYGPAINPSARPDLEGFQSHSHSGELLQLDYTHIKAQRDKERIERQKSSERALTRLRQAKSAGSSTQDSIARQILAQDPSARMRAAHSLNATMTADSSVARGIVCPNRAGHKKSSSGGTVWFTINPMARGVSHWARCNHINSCGWSADLFDLINS